MIARFTMSLSVLVTSLFVIAGPVPASAAPVADWIDTTYGVGGSQVFSGEGHWIPMGTMDSAGRALIVTVNENYDQIRVRRLTTAGALDNTFAGGALMLPAIPQQVFADADGRLIVADIPGGSGGLRISRFTTAGVLDSGFGGGDGEITLLAGATAIHSVQITQRQDGSLMVVFTNEHILPATSYVAGITPAGALDTTWAPGAATPGLLTLPDDFVYEVAAAGNTVLVAGYESDFGDTTGVRRFTAAGAVDNGFSGDGKVVFPEGFGARSITVANGAYYVGATKSVPLDPDTSMALTKVLPSGDIDTTFGDGGYAIGDGHHCGINPEAVLVTGSEIYLTGDFMDCGDYPMNINRFTLEGDLDPAFGTDGSLILDQVDGYDSFGGVGLGVQGGKLVAAFGRVIGEGDSIDMGTIRLKAEVEEPPAAAGSFVELSPARILDTRSGNGAPAGPVAGFGAVTLQVGGRGGVPASGVSAVILNVTVTQPTTAGHVIVYPTGTAAPVASNLNFVAGQTIPNLVTVKLGTDGKVTLQNNSGGAHLIADVAGYYVAGTPSEPGTFASLAPSRILDTRSGNGAPAGPVAGFGAVTLQVGGRGGVPASGVSAVILNVTVTQPTTAGHVIVYPTGTAAPVASNLNFVAGQTIPNLVTVKLGTDGKVTLQNNSGGAHLIADVAGYYVAGTPTLPGTFVALAPSRVLDTRSGNGAPTGPIAGFAAVVLQCAGRGGVPASGAAAVVLNVTVTEPTTAGHVIVYPTGTAAPVASNLNFVAGQTIPNLVTVKLGTDGKVTLQNNSGGAHLIADVAGYFLS